MFEFANHLVLKVTKGCNLRCEYCYVKDKDESQGVFIDYTLFKDMIDRVIEDKIRASPQYRSNPFNLTFHGGEPTMLDKNLFFKMCEYAQKRFMDAGIPLTLSMQSNLTLIDEEWARLLNKFGVHLGLSWDGVEEANAARTNKSNELYMQKIELLRKYNVPLGFLIVVSKQSLPYYNKSVAYIKERFGMNAKANYVEDVFTPLGDASPIEISGKEFFEGVMKPEIDAYISSQETREANSNDIINKFVLDYLTGVGNYYSSPGNCYIKYCGSGINIIEVNPDGSVQMCGRYGNAENDETIVSHVLAKDFLSAHQIQKHLWFTKQKIAAMKKTHCDDCYAQNICDHGCMAFFYSKTGRWGMRNDLTCGMFKPAYQYLMENAHQVIESFFMSNLKKPGDQHSISLPTNVGYFQIFGDKINDLMKKHSVSITNKDGMLIFIKGDNNVKCDSNPSV